MKTVYFDFETGGITEDKPNIQLAAVAVDEKWNEVGSFEMKIQFDESKADAKALEINHYDRAVWAKEAKPQPQVIALFDAFLVNHRDMVQISKRTNKPYSVAQLAGHNAAQFDYPRLKRAYGEMFLPAYPLVLDTLQLAMWHFRDKKDRPVDFKLPTLMKFLQEQEFLLPGAFNAHNSVDDVRASYIVAKWITMEQWQQNDKIAAGR